MDSKLIVVGVTGGIAAYKTVEVVSRLKKAGFQVVVIMTKGATNFVAPLTFREISGNPVITDMWAEPKRWRVEHVALAQEAAAFLVAPATANFIGKAAHGLADDMLTTAILATKAPVLIAPAMNNNMYENAIVQENIAKLITLGFIIIEPTTGLLACGAEGRGRLPEPEYLVARLIDAVSVKKDLAGKKVLVTAGGTREPLDPVRYIGNRSSGKMGFAIAAAAAQRGAAVHLVSGPDSLTPPAGVTLTRVETAEQMRQAVLAEFPAADAVIKAAAVADYRPKQVSEHKIKKQDQDFILVLERGPDILQELGRLKTHQVLVGFAAETADLAANALAKLTAKNLDMIVANDVTLAGAGFESDTNIVKIFYRDGRVEEVPKMEKTRLAHIILDRVRDFFKTDS